MRSAPISQVDSHNSPSDRCGTQHAEPPVDRIALTTAYIAAKPLQRLVRDHGHPCRIVVRDGAVVLRCAYQWAGDSWRGCSWAVDSVTPSLNCVEAWLGY